MRSEFRKPRGYLSQNPTTRAMRPSGERSNTLRPVPAGSPFSFFALQGVCLRARGDMYLEAMVETPVKLTERQRQLLREFAAGGSDEEHSPESHGFFAKVKELWQDLRE